MGIFNELWDMTSKVINAARAIYRGVDEVKLRDYTVSHLVKRVNAEGAHDTEPVTPV